MDIEQFRKDFTEFSKVEDYPDSMIKFWSATAELSISKDRAGNLYLTVSELATAHYITLARNDSLSASTGASPGAGGGGVVSSKTIGSVSVNYDTAITAIKDGGHWNQTKYGRMYLEHMRRLGAGGCVC